MLKYNFLFYSLKIFKDLIREIAYFPFWWYSAGLINLLKILQKFIVNKEKSLALRVWLKNIFRPMYGQYDWAGILISFGVRLVQIIARSIFLLFWLIFALVILIGWLILPIFVIYEIIFQIAL